MTRLPGPALVVLVSAHTLVSIGTVSAIAHFGAGADVPSLQALCLSSAGLAGIGFAATARYLSTHMRPRSGLLAGSLCGALCGAILGIAPARLDFSLLLFLAIFVPSLLAVLLASFIDRPKSGWQSGRVA